MTGTNIATGAASGSKRRRLFKKFLIGVGAFWVLILVVAGIGAAVGGTSSTKPKAAKKSAAATGTSSKQPSSKTTSAATDESASKPSGAALSWIKSNGDKAGYVAYEIATVETKINGKSIDDVASSAQKAHDDLDVLRSDFPYASGSDSFSNAQNNVMLAADDMKNAMGALVAWTGNPNPATLAQFTTKWANARSEWNSGVTTIWRLAQHANPPTV